jgi:hypothetical protein
MHICKYHNETPLYKLIYTNLKKKQKKKEMS